jgi:hypothetical protein
MAYPTIITYLAAVVTEEEVADLPPPSPIRLTLTVPLRLPQPLLPRRLALLEWVHYVINSC